MKSTYSKIIILSLFSTLLGAEDAKFYVTENGVDVNLPLDIDKVRIEGSFYNNKSSKIVDFGLIENNEGRKGTKRNKQNWSLSAYYRVRVWDANVFFGLEYENFELYKEQIGFGIENRTTRHIPFENFIELKGEKGSFVVDTTYQSTNSYPTKLQLGIRVANETKLNISQNTKFYPEYKDGFKYESDYTLGLSGNIKLEGKQFVNEYIDIGGELSYSFMPYEYKLKIGDSLKNISYNEEKTVSSIKIHFKLPKNKHFLSPTIGYRWSKLRNEVTGDGKIKDIKDELFFAGVEAWF